MEVTASVTQSISTYADTCAQQYRLNFMRRTLQHKWNRCMAQSISNIFFLKEIFQCFTIHYTWLNDFQICLLFTFIELSTEQGLPLQCGFISKCFITFWHNYYTWECHFNQASVEYCLQYLPETLLDNFDELLHCLLHFPFPSMAVLTGMHGSVFCVMAKGSST